MNKLKKLYNNQYINTFINSPEERIFRLLKYIPFSKKDIIADYGCGNGKLLPFIYKKIKKYYGVDFSNKFIKIAHQNQKKLRIKNAYFFCEDINLFCKKNLNKFDKVFSFDFTEHLYDKELIKIFTNIKKTLKNKGHLYLHTPNSQYFIETLKNKGILKQFPEHVGIRSFAQYKKILTKIGFKRIKVKYLPHYIPLLKNLHFLSFLPFLGKYFQARLFIVCSK